MVIKTRHIKSRTHTYPAVMSASFDGIGQVLFEDMGVRRVIVISDALVSALWWPHFKQSLAPYAFDVTLVTMPLDESSKSLETWRQLIDRLLGMNIQRDTVLIALGGGVVGDVVGFAAATLLRGLRWVLVPTTLLAMVDSSVGGKVGVNHARGKNLVGAFCAPQLVWAAMDCLRTLPPRTLRSGLAEVVKVALLRDGSLFSYLESSPKSMDMVRVVDQAIAVKAAIVQEDEHETGARALLNLGHTTAHALECASEYGTIEHGEAVAIGIVRELALSTRHGWTTDPSLLDRVRALFDALELSTAWPRALSQDALIRAARLDKKAHGAMLRLPILVKINVASLHDTPWSLIDELWSTS